ncbi:MAG TPA: DUF5977 domain-containing protein, partial [Flavobacterium sp.]|uniref:DUF5977 domain-containing protein n=1 Tax=Flavobacterium sp. TaxID=239 RepID=UPI002DB6E62E
YSATGSGSHIGYDEVVEVNLDNSYTKHFFTNYGTDINGIPHFDQSPLATTGWQIGDQSIYMKYSSLECERGKAIAIYDFKDNDVLVKKNNYTYRYDSARFNIYEKEMTYSDSYNEGNDVLLFATATKNFTYDYYPIKNDVTTYNANGTNPITTTSNFVYNAKNKVVSKSITTSISGQDLKTNYFYAYDLISEPFMLDLVNKFQISEAIAEDNYINNILISKQKTTYANNATTSNLLLPKSIYSAKFPNELPNILNIGQLEKKITYDQYDDKGNIQQYTPENGTSVSIIWGYGKTQPIAKIENATYAQIASALGITPASLSTYTEANLTTINGLRSNVSLSNALITTYTHKPLIGVTTITDPKGFIAYYEYDNFNRLVLIKDQNSKILKTFCYNYQGQAENCITVIEYKNIVKTGKYKKNNCGAGFVGSDVVYTVPANTYSSNNSQAEADNLAQADVIANGQNYANTNGSCLALPAAPTGVTFTSATASSINLSWNAVPGATGYNLYIGGVVVGYSGVTVATLTGLTSGTAYSIQVQACSSLGNGALSTAVSMSTLPAVPNAVTGLTFTSATSSVINFSWAAVAGATGYKIHKNGAYASTIATPTNTGSLSGLASATPYNIQVLAYNAVGDGALSSSVSMSTTAPSMGFYKTSGTYPTVTGSTLNGTIVNTLANPIYIYLVVQSASTSSGSGNGSLSYNGTTISAGGTFTQYGQSFVSTNYIYMGTSSLIVSGGYYGNTGSQMILAYSLSPGGPLTYWPNSN